MKRFTIIISFIMLTFMPLMAQVKQTVAVLGDSYSTFEGFIPKGYATWYSPTTPPETTDVNKVEQTWWWQVIKEGGYKMGNINSYSGATICNTGYRDEDYTDRSFITRSSLLGNPDIILICGATNDNWLMPRSATISIATGSAQICTVSAQPWPSCFPISASIIQM